MQDQFKSPIQFFKFFKSFILSSVVLTTTSHAQVIDTSYLTRPQLTEGQCHTLTDAKYYWKDIQGPDKLSIRQKIGEKLVQSVKDGFNEVGEKETDINYFFCQSRCLLQKTEYFVWVKNSDSASHFNNLNGFVCDGLDVRDVAVSSTLTLKTTVAEPRMAVLSKADEIHERLQSLSYKISPNDLNSLLLNFYQTLKTTSQAYSLASSGLFLEAGLKLKAYDSSEPEFWKKTEAKIQSLQNQGWKVNHSILDLKESEDLVNLFFKTNGRFLIYL